MDFWKTVLGLIRRRSVALPLLAAAVVLAALGFFLTPTKYISSTTMVLTTPTGGGTLSQDPAKPTGLTNPLLNFDEGLKTAATIIIHGMNTPATQETLGLDKDGGTKLTIDDGRSNLDLLGKDGPFVYIEGESSSASTAHDLVVAAQGLVRAELENRQKALGAPPTTFIKLVDVIPPSTPEASMAGKYQIAGIAFVLALVLGLAGAYTALRMRQRRLPGTPDTVVPDPPVNGKPVDTAAKPRPFPAEPARLPGI